MEGILNAALAQELRLETLANNMANVNTAGYKEDKVFYLEEILNDGTNDTAAATDAYLPGRSTLVLPVSTFTNFSQGPLKQTGNPLDLAIDGDGFFAVSTPDGKQYTRNGSFSLNEEGVLVTQEGYPVMGAGGEITIDGDHFNFNAKGSLVIDGEEADTLEIVTFSDLKGLKKVGQTLFVPANPDDAGSEAEDVSIRPGHLEQSNVETVKAMTEMIEVLRGYEAYQKALKTEDGINQKAVNEVGRLT